MPVRPNALQLIAVYNELKNNRDLYEGQSVPRTRQMLGRKGFHVPADATVNKFYKELGYSMSRNISNAKAAQGVGVKRIAALEQELSELKKRLDAIEELLS